MIRAAVLALLAIPLVPAAPAQEGRVREEPVVVGSKAFTESVILGAVAAQQLTASGIDAEHRRELGGTRFLWSALLAGDIDVYPEYTGTIRQEILAGDDLAPDADLALALARYGVRMTEPLGFDNTYALAMDSARAAALGIATISDLVRHPDLRIGFSNEFMDRGDGWPALRSFYGFPHADVRGIDHDLAYRGLDAGSIDVMDVYSTDAEIAYYGLTVLEDDRSFFPSYQAVYLYRSDLGTTSPGLPEALAALAGMVPEDAMIRLNARAKLERLPESQIAADFLQSTFGTRALSAAEPRTRAERVADRTAEHIELVAISLTAAIAIAIPLGILAAKVASVSGFVLGLVGIIYTIPSLALLVFMIPLFGIGGPPALVALFLYSLLPIVRNTHAGLQDIDPALLESADALGLDGRTKLLQIELPLAARSILAGIKTAAVINVGTATLGALIGAGGYGQPILTGIRLDDLGLILEGAVPAAVLALVVQGAFDLAERIAVPRGLRLSSTDA